MFIYKYENLPHVKTLEFENDHANCLLNKVTTNTIIQLIVKNNFAETCHFALVYSVFFKSTLLNTNLVLTFL